jgi:FkbH-like protein
VKVDFVGNIITQPIAKYLAISGSSGLSIHHHSYNQVIQALSSKLNTDALIVCLTPEYFFGPGIASDESMEIMNQLIKSIHAFLQANDALIIVGTLYCEFHRVSGKKHIDRKRLTATLNEKLFSLSDSTSRVSIADIAGCLEHIGYSNSIRHENSYIFQMPYSLPALRAIALEYSKVLSERFLPRKKVIIVDADNTLWGGVLGEDDWPSLKIGSEYPGIIYKNFQECLKQIAASGVLLALVSKNNQDDLDEAFKNLSMPLSTNDFVLIKANWLNKSSNIIDISNELSVGTDSIVFIDDNPAELAEVKAQLPDVDTYHFTIKNAANPLQWLSSFASLSVWSPTEEDAVRSQLYIQDFNRKVHSSAFQESKDYLQSLEMLIKVGENRLTYVDRIVQLCNKTNQFNMTTKRCTSSEIISFFSRGKIFDFSLTDRFGDMGIVGLVMIESDTIVNFLLSCRALGRTVEHAMVRYVVAQHAPKQLKALFIPTAKNKPAENFYDQIGATCVSKDAKSIEYVLVPNALRADSYECSLSEVS